VACAAARDLYEFVTDTAVTPNVIIAPPIHFPLLCFIHVFIRFCLCLAGSIRNRGDGEMCRTVFLPLNQIPYVLHVYFIVTVIVEELKDYSETPIPFSSCYFSIQMMYHPW
jgi:hypothetical protein